MSDEAFGWLKTITAPDPLARAVLKELCGYADTFGVTWSPVPVLAFDLMKSERQIQRALRALEKAGLMKASGRFHHRNVPFYQLALDCPGDRAEQRKRIVARVKAEASGRRRKSVDKGPENPNGNNALNGDMGVTVEKSNGDVDGAPNGDMGDTQQKGTTPSEGKPSSGRARAGEAIGRDVIRDRAFAAYPLAGRKGVSSKREFDEAWASEVAGGGDPADIEAAIVAYAADRSLWGSSGKPVAAHTFLGRGRWADIADARSAAAAQAVAGHSRWNGPAEIREKVAAANGVGVRGALSLLDRCTWNGSAVIAPGVWSRDQLRQVLSGSDVTVLVGPAAAAASGERG